MNNKKIKIAIADDHQIVLDGLRSMLKDNNEFELAGEANNGKQLLQIIQSVSVDVALVDIDMPVMNGIETTKAIVKNHPQTKVLVLTMHNEKAMIDKILHVGATGYVLKNADQKELFMAIQKVAEGENYFCSEITNTLLAKNATQISTKNQGSPLSANLTNREEEILKLVAEGYSNREIGDQLFISPRTVDTHRTNLMSKLEVNNTAGLVKFAIKNGYVE